MKKVSMFTKDNLSENNLSQNDVRNYPYSII